MPREKPPMIPSTARYAKVFAAALSLLAGTTCLAQQHSPTPFTREVESHFATWDRNHDGTLEADELDALVVDTHVKGSAAAAVAALKAAQRSVASSTCLRSHARLLPQLRRRGRRRARSPRPRLISLSPAGLSASTGRSGMSLPMASRALKPATRGRWATASLSPW